MMLFRLVWTIILFVFVVSIYAAEAFEEIPPVIVKTDQSMDPYSVTAGTKMITEDQIRASDALSVSQLIQANMGLQVNDLYGDGSRVALNMRGFGENASSNTLVLIDGVPLSNPDIGTPDINMLPLSEFKQIEILPGSGGVLYGDQAVGGIVNLITKSPKKKERQVVVAYGSYASRKIKAVFGDLFENGLGYRFSANYYQTDNYRDHNENRLNNLNAFLYYNGRSNDLSFRYHKNNLHLQLPGALTGEQVEEDPRQAENDISFNHQDIDSFLLAFKHQIADGWHARMNASFRQMRGHGAFDFFGVFPFTESRRVETLQPELRGEWEGFHHTFFPVIGCEITDGQYRFNKGRPSKQKKRAIYGQLDIPFTHQIGIAVGARRAIADYPILHASNDATVTNVTVSWQVKPTVRLFGKRAESYRFPKVDEQTWTLTGDPLKTQMGISYEVGASWRRRQLTSSIIGYQLNLRHEIVSIPVSSSDYFVYNENLDPTRRRGVILDVGFSPKKNWQLAANYHFVDATFNSGDYKGKRIPFVAQNTFRLMSTTTFRSYYHLLVEGVFVGNRYPINDVENREDPLGGYTIYNVGLGYHHLDYAIDLRVNNLTNKRYNTYSVSTYLGSAVSTVFYPAKGICGLLSVSMTL